MDTQVKAPISESVCFLRVLVVGSIRKGDSHGRYRVFAHAPVNHQFFSFLESALNPKSFEVSLNPKKFPLFKTKKNIPIILVATTKVSLKMQV